MTGPSVPGPTGSRATLSASGTAVVLDGGVQIERVDPLDLDLATTGAMAGVEAASLDAADSRLPRPPGPTKLEALQPGSHGLPVAGPWLAREGDSLIGYAAAHLPMEDPEAEEDHWDADRVRAYDRALAARQQTVHRVLARHRPTGEWAGLSILCIDEFGPFRRAPGGRLGGPRPPRHRLGLLMKADKLRRVDHERPEVVATDTWNATTNHHMTGVNERLGARVVAEVDTYRLREDRL